MTKLYTFDDAVQSYAQGFRAGRDNAGSGYRTRGHQPVTSLAAWLDDHTPDIGSIERLIRQDGCAVADPSQVCQWTAGQVVDFHRRGFREGTADGRRCAGLSPEPAEHSGVTDMDEYRQRA